MTKIFSDFFLVVFTLRHP